MITINLLPEEFRAKKKVTHEIPVLKYFFIGGAIFILLTLVFFVDFLMVSAKLGRLNGHWKKIQPQYQTLTQLQSEVEGPLKQEKDFMVSSVATLRPLVYILQWCSEFLPDTAWLTEMKMERKTDGDNFLLRGLALSSKQSSSIESIQNYLHQLKEKMPEANLSLTTTRQTLEGADVTEFIANFHWGGQK